MFTLEEQFKGSETISKEVRRLMQYSLGKQQGLFHVCGDSGDGDREGEQNREMSSK